MTKKLLSTIIACAGVSVAANAQLPVSTAPQNKKVVLEEFTGIYCQHCPDGHKRANAIKAAYSPGEVILVNIHTGGYAAPNGKQDYRTSEGTSIAAISGMNIQGYPTGSVNRHLFSGASGFAVSRGLWDGYATQIINEQSYVNVALQGVLDTVTRELKVEVEAYYTANGPANNRLTVMVLEDSVIGHQVDNNGSGTRYYPEMRTPDGQYIHMHMLRKVISSGATGETISPTTQGTKITKNYTYTVPATYNNIAPNLKNLKIVAFIAESASDIMTGAEGPIYAPPAASVNDLNISKSISIYPNPASNGVTVNLNSPLTDCSVKLTDLSGKVVYTAKVQLDSRNAFYVPTAQLANGTYFLQVASKESVGAQQIVIAH